LLQTCPRMSFMPSPTVAEWGIRKPDQARRFSGSALLRLPRTNISSASTTAVRKNIDLPA
jgi:hypothetical protein